jgi:hypothetical protein
MGGESALAIIVNAPLMLGLVLTKLPIITADVLLWIQHVGVNVSLLLNFLFSAQPGLTRRSDARCLV